MGVHLSVILREINREVKEQYAESNGNLPVHQIRTSYNILYHIKQTHINDKIRKHKDDLESVKLWEKEYASDIIYAKYQTFDCKKYKVI